ncbi:MAG: recombination mediator RecR, partial [Cetobacterium sp.]
MATKSLEILIDEFNRLPGIGRKSAVRLAFHVLEMSDTEVERFSKALKDVKETVKKCSVCGNFSENEMCDICRDEFREKDVICVLEDSRDIIPLEKTNRYKGTYNVLNGKIDPLNGMTPDKLNLKSLLERVAKDEIKEV